MSSNSTLLANVRAKLRAAARDDFYLFYTMVYPEIDPNTPFSKSPHFRALAAAFEKVITGETPYLCVTLPPRYGKSMIGSVALPAYMLGRDPGARIICGSYAGDVARRFAKQTRQLMISPVFTDIFGDVLEKKDGPVSDLNTIGQGYRLATSVDGMATGRGANIIIVDDPLKAADGNSAAIRETAHEWLRSTLMSRFDPGGQPRMIVIMQRLHQDDPVGRLMTEDGWTLLEMPAHVLAPTTYDIGHGKVWTPKVGEALFPEGVSLERLAERRVAMGVAAFNAQFLQRPELPGGALFKMKHIQRYDPPRPYRHKIEMIVQSWDPAISENDNAAYSVCTTWAICGKDLYLLDVFRRRMEYPRLTHAILSLQKTHRAHKVIIEATGIGGAVWQDVRRKAKDPTIFVRVNPKQGKVERATIQLPRFENRRVYLPNEAPWLEAFENEVAAFPLGKYADQVDLMVQFFAGLSSWNEITCQLKEAESQGRPGDRQARPLPIPGQVHAHVHDPLKGQRRWASTFEDRPFDPRRQEREPQDPVERIGAEIFLAREIARTGHFAGPQRHLPGFGAGQSLDQHSVVFDRRPRRQSFWLRDDDSASAAFQSGRYDDLHAHLGASDLQARAGLGSANSGGRGD